MYTFRRALQAWPVALACVLSACGGGGEDETGSGSTYLAVTGTKQVTGSPTVTVCVNNIASASANSTNGQQVAANVARYYLLGGNYQVTSAEGRGCDNLPGALSISVDDYNGIVVPWVNANPTSPGTPGGGTVGATPRSFITWSGSDNGQVVKDANNEDFAFYSDTGCVYSYNTRSETSNFCLNNPREPNNATAQFDGLTVRVASVTGTGGGCITQLVSGGGRLVDIHTSSGIQTAAESSAVPNYCSGGAGPGAPTPREFISWSNSANGQVVVDANNERFAFYSDTRCIYSFARNQETTNFCLTSQNSGSFAGQPVVVLYIRSTSGGCITGLADPSGFQIDIYTDASGTQIVQRQNAQWDTSGCTR